MRKNYNLEKRKYVIGAFVAIVAAIFIFRLFDLQIHDSTYKQSADSNAFLKKTVYPSRGLIYDRDSTLVVYNQPAYDVMLIPRDVQEFDTLDFCRTLNLTKAQLDAMVREQIEDELVKIRQQATDDAVNTAMILLLTLPLEVLMDHYWPKSYAKRIPQFTTYVLEYYERWQNGELDMEKLKED